MKRAAAAALAKRADRTRVADARSPGLLAGFAAAASTAAICAAASSSASCCAIARRSASSISSLALRAWWKAMPVPAGISRPTMTFSFRPRSSSRLPMIAASVSTRVVSWNDAAEMKLSVDSDALVMPSSTSACVAGILPSATHAVVGVEQLRALDLLAGDVGACRPG